MSRAKPRAESCPYVGRGGLKLKFALDDFGVNVRNSVAIDLGCHVGGFTDCMLQGGATKVYAVDTAYGLLAWKLRQDPRVIVCERENALYWTTPEPADIISIDAGWTPQRLVLPAAARMLKPEGRILSLVKPQYEVPKEWLQRGVLAEERLAATLPRVKADVPPTLRLLGEARSPYVGSGGNAEYWWLLART
jgi:23S rRNA (cytidine1920-2'-O)/16S rRNA (cytidine1409-2'-O)-methyltransferase